MKKIYEFVSMPFGSIYTMDEIVQRLTENDSIKNVKQHIKSIVNLPVGQSHSLPKNTGTIIRLPKLTLVEENDS